MIKKQEKYMNPYTDFGFKKLFGTAPNKEFLLSFLNSLFQGRRSPIVDLHYLNTEILGAYYGDRNSVFDVYCTTEDKGHIIVEMQRSEQPYFKDRTLYYASSAIVQQAPKGKWDYELDEVCVVGILNFVFPDKEYPEDSYIHEVRLRDGGDYHVVNEKLTFYYLEMPKFGKTEGQLVTMLDKWLYIVKNICYLMERPKEIQERVFTRFFEEARIGMLTPEERQAYEESRKHLWDNYNTISFAYSKGKKAGVAEGKELGIAEGKELGIAEGKELGIAEGKELGIVQNKLETARRMLSMGLGKEAILEATGLTEADFSSLVLNE